MVVYLSGGKRVEVGVGATVVDVIKALNLNEKTPIIAAKINGKTSDLTTLLNEGDEIELLTFNTPEGKQIFWHSSSHVLAQAVQELFPSAKLAIGPAIENGFYYDFDNDTPFTPEDLDRIEKKAKEIIERKLNIIRLELSKEELREYFKKKNEVYKLELLEEIEGTPTAYKQGEWMDLCRGPHITNTRFIKAFKVLSLAGAYWRGNEKNKMLQRIYGISFPEKAMLDEYLAFLEEAQKRDHRKLGKELDLFSFHQEGIGFPFWHPKGMILYNIIMDYSRKRHLEAGYLEVKTPIILTEELWHRSGHWDKYRENMYFTEIDEKIHAVKPMNCPGHLLIYKNAIRSYRDLPLKFFEFGLVHRHEKAGVLHGLFRVRQFTQDDAHIFCTPEQIESQITEVMAFIMSMYKTFGFEEYKIELSTKPEKYIGSDEIWEKAESALKAVLDKQNIEYKINEGDGAFYGPKIDFHIKDTLKRSWQCGTIQLDFSMPERFELEYTDADGRIKRPVMIHRALFGSMERFIGILLENYGGVLPFWLSPVQVVILPVSEKFTEYANTLSKKMMENSIRVEVDIRNEKIGYKIRDAEVKKIPYMCIVGEKEQQKNSVSVRKHGKIDYGEKQIDEFISFLISENQRKAI